MAPQVCGLVDWGCYQDFQRGVISASTSEHFALTGPIQQKWVSLEPSEASGPGRCTKMPRERRVLPGFHVGRDLLVPSRNIRHGRPNPRGVEQIRTSKEVLVCPYLTGDAWTGVCFQDFVRGVISSKAGAFGLSGPIRQAWNEADYERGLGYPVSAQKCSTSTTSARGSNAVSSSPSPQGTFSVTRANSVSVEWPRRRTYPRCARRRGPLSA